VHARKLADGLRMTKSTRPRRPPHSRKSGHPALDHAASAHIVPTFMTHGVTITIQTTQMHMRKHVIELSLARWVR